jgi:hypothetical protein
VLALAGPPGSAAAQPVDAAATASAPGVPTGVYAKESIGDLEVGWDAVSGATGYEVLIRDVTTKQTAFSEATWTQDPLSSAPLAQIDFSDFTDGDEYAFEVVATDASGASTPSTQVTVIAVGDPFTQYAAAGDSAAFFGWQDPPGATSYQVTQYDNCDFDYSDPIAVTAKQVQVSDPDGTTSTWVTVDDLTDGECYDFVIASYNSTDGDYPAGQSLDTLLEPIGTPTWSTSSPSSAGDGSAQLTWNSATGATEYQVYSSDQTKDENDYGLVGTVTPVAGATQSLTVPNLVNGDVYSFYVVAYDDNSGDSSTEPENLQPIGTPMWQGATAGNGSAQLTWNSATGATEYQVYSSDQTKDENDYGLVGTVTPVAGATQSLTVPNLVNGDVYSFYVIAADDNAGKSASAVINVTPGS